MTVTGEHLLLYEQPPLLRIAGDAIRPGGLDLTDRAMSLCALEPGAWVLDAGCGQGATVEHLASRYRLRAVGVDPSAFLLRAGLERAPSAPLIQAVGEALPVASDLFAAVFAECTLSLMDRERALAEFHRVLHDDGWLILTDMYARDPAGAAELRHLPVRSCVAGAVSREELIASVTAHGFSVRLWEDHTDALKRFAARLIWEHGSLANFWQCAAQTDGSVLDGAVTLSRPGYYLMIAQKSRD
ncbi:MAG: class I SAM-dependent methyltransferase [Chloroflexi bacterium]|nr:class I SAM-dependent methyltransferase [Chloroflexota bacterium]